MLRIKNKSLSSVAQQTLILAMVLSSFLVGCAKDSDKKKVTAIDQQVPAHLDFVAPKVGPALSSEQIAEIKSTFKAKKSPMLFPPGDLVFPNSQQSKEERLRKESDYKDQDPNGYVLVKSIQKNCIKNRPTEKIDATFPIDGANVTNLLPGDHLEMNMTAGLFGETCPIELSGQSIFEANVKMTEPENQKALVSGGASSKLKFLLKNPDLAEQLGAKGIIVDESVSGIATVREKSEESTRSLVKVDFSGEFLSLTSTVPFDAKIEVLNNGSTQEAQGIINLKMPKFETQLVVRSIKPEGQTIATITYYLNGELTTSEKLKSLFGENVPTQVMENGSVQSLR